MSNELIAVLGALGGTLVGGFINYVATRSVKNHEWKLALAKDQVATRQKLYAEFLVEAQRFVIQSRENKISSLADLNPLNGKFAEVSLVAPEAVVHTARAVTDYALCSQSADNAATVSNFFALRQAFIDSARKDIASILHEI